MDLGIKGRNAIVTGGSRGLGLQCALSLAREGVNVAICGRTKATLDSAVLHLKSFDVKAVGVQADASDIHALPAMHQAIVEQLGHADILVNNVGGSLYRAGIEGTSLDGYKETFDLNLYNSFELMRLVLPHMKEQKWGRIINIASIFGRELGGNIGYMSAKAALIAATKHAAIELAKTGVLINSIAPGSISHPGGSWERFQNDNPQEVVDEFIDRNLPMGRFGWPEPVGDTAAFLASERANLITGACIVVDGGQSHSLF
jgi:3-oxoacyl-[acyl-carrier protein] reductase